MNCNELEQQIDRATGTPTSTSANPSQKKSRERLCEVTCYCRLLEYTAFLLFSRDTIHAVSSYVAYLDIKNQVQARFHPPPFCIAPYPYIELKRYIENQDHLIIGAPKPNARYQILACHSNTQKWWTK